MQGIKSSSIEAAAGVVICSEFQNFFFLPQNRSTKTKRGNYCLPPDRPPSLPLQTHDNIVFPQRCSGGLSRPRTLTDNFIVMRTLNLS